MSFTPDLNAQRAAMTKLEFLVGKWSGEGRQLRPSGEWAAVTQTEDAHYKLGGLLLEIEGTGITQALGIISYDDESGKYHMRAFNDGRFLETDVNLLADLQGMTWGFSLGQYRTSATMRIDEKGNWTESHEITIGTQPPRKFMEVSVGRR